MLSLKLESNYIKPLNQIYLDLIIRNKRIVLFALLTIISHKSLINR